MAEDDKDIKRLLMVSSETFDEHTKRIGALLTKAQDKFERDYTSYAAVVGSALMAFAGVLAWFGKSESFAIVVALSGASILVVGLLLRHISADKQVRQTKTLLEFERERSRFAQRSAVFQQLWLYGQPKNVSLEEIRFLLGEAPVSGHPNSQAKQITEKSTEED